MKKKMLEELLAETHMCWAEDREALSLSKKANENLLNRMAEVIKDNQFQDRRYHEQHAQLSKMTKVFELWSDIIDEINS